MTKVKNTFQSFRFCVLLLFLAVIITVLNIEFYGVILFVLLISAILVLSDDILDTTCPFLILCAFVSICYDSFNTFIKLAPLALLPIGALIYHYVKYKSRTLFTICKIIKISILDLQITSFSDFHSRVYPIFTNKKEPHFCGSYSKISLVVFWFSPCRC